MTTPDQDPLDPATAALAAGVLDICRHVDDAPLRAPRWFALARSSALLASSPALASLLGGEDAPAADDLELTPIELDESTGAPASALGASDPLDGLSRILWPDLAAGGALACDLAPDRWSLRDGTDDRALPADRPLRIVVGALADGTTWSALRRADGDGYVLGAALVPALTSALLQTLQETEAG
ncbi:PPA1309 family protein [Brachybacterium sp. DNPG3]